MFAACLPCAHPIAHSVFHRLVTVLCCSAALPAHSSAPAGCCGLSEEDAIARFGAANIEVYHSNYTPLEWTIVDARPQNRCYAKLVVNKADSERIVGFHVLGPNAGALCRVQLRCPALH